MIPQIQPWIDKEELKEVIKVIKSTWVTEHAETELFTRDLKKVTKSGYVLVVDHGTSALHLCLMALGIGPGDEVIVPDITFGATANTVLFTGAKPVFVDVDSDSLIHIDPEKIEEKITKKTKAIMPVHLYGYAADMDKIMKIARKHNLYVVEDAAQGIGVTYNKRHVGTIGDGGILSFYGNKSITTGEGGAVLTGNKKLYSKAENFAHEGRNKGEWIQTEVGHNYHFTDIQAAIGVAQLRKLSKIISGKRRVYETYYSELSGLSAVKFIPLDKKIHHTFWMTVIFVKNAKALAGYLLKNGVQTREMFYPLHMQPSYKSLKIKGSFPNAERSYKEGLALPSTATLATGQVRKIANLIKKFYKSK
jgi:perosamine synthetase